MVRTIIKPNDITPTIEEKTLPFKENKEVIIKIYYIKLYYL